MLEYLEQVQRGGDYIEANLDFEIELTKVSRVAGISHWHFQRIFKSLTGETLKAYVRARRFAGALERLLSTNESILAIGIRAGYESQEAFSRAFKRAFEMSPGAYRRLGESTKFPRKVQISRDYLFHLSSNLSLHPELCFQPRMSLVGLKTTFYSVDSDKNNLGSRLPPLWREFLPLLVWYRGLVTAS